MEKTISTQTKHDDLESVVEAWEEFGLTLEDIIVLTCLPMFGERTSIKIILDEIDEKKFEARTMLNTSYKGSYRPWLRYFQTEKGVIVES